MADIFDTLQPDQGNGDIFDQVSTPKGMNLLQTAADTYERAGMGAYDAMKWIPGVKQLANMGATPLNTADVISNSLKSNANLGQQIVQGTGQALSTIPFASPFMATAGSVIANPLLAGAVGMGGFNAGKAMVSGQPIIPAAAQGAAQGALFGGMGQIGSNVASKIVSPLEKSINPIFQSMVKSAPTVGSASGMAAGGALMPGTPDQRISNAMVGGGLGLLNPVSPSNTMTQEDYNGLIDKNADTYRTILNPPKGTINKVEIKSGKDLDDAFNLAANEGLIINKDVNNKLDTTQAIQQIQPKMNALNQQINTEISNDPYKQFDLNDLLDATHNKLNSTIKNASDLKTMLGESNGLINDEISRQGQFVNGQTLNQIKQGMWGKSYNNMAPTSNATAQAIGNTAKGMIEEAYPNSNIQSLNSAYGKYADLKDVLANAHGNVVQSGKIGKYAAQGTGMVTGALLGSHVPMLGEILGPLAGREVGGKVSDYMNDPSRITQGLANSIKGIKISNPRIPAKFYPGLTPMTPVDAPSEQMISEGSPVNQFNPLNRRGTQ